MSPKKDDEKRLTQKAAIARMVDRSGRTRTDICKRLGHERTYIVTLLNRPSSTSVTTFLRIANACGYQLMLVNDDADDVIILDDGESS